MTENKLWAISRYVETLSYQTGIISLSRLSEALAQRAYKQDTGRQAKDPTNAKLNVATFENLSYTSNQDAEKENT